LAQHPHQIPPHQRDRETARRHHNHHHYLLEEEEERDRLRHREMYNYHIQPTPINPNLNPNRYPNRNHNRHTYYDNYYQIPNNYHHNNNYYNERSAIYTEGYVQDDPYLNDLRQRTCYYKLKKRDVEHVMRVTSSTEEQSVSALTQCNQNVPEAIQLVFRST